MSGEPVQIPTNKNQALRSLEEASSYFLVAFMRNEEGELVFSGYVSAESFPSRRELWGAVQHWLAHDMVKCSLDNGWLEE